jgi:hypothetical protein
MSDAKRPQVDPSAVTRKAIKKMPDEERRKVQNAIRKALDERDLPKFKAGISKLGISETSAEYARLMQLWDEFARPNRD